MLNYIQLQNVENLLNIFQVLKKPDLCFGDTI